LANSYFGVFRQAELAEHGAQAGRIVSARHVEQRVGIAADQFLGVSVAT
jgi:hypothetical protein